MDILVFDREKGEGVVGIIAFLVSRRLARLFTEDIPVPLIFSVGIFRNHQFLEHGLMI